MLSYIGALHDPKPHDVAFGVVGTSPLPVAVGKQFSLKIDPLPERVGRAHRDRPTEDRRSVRRRPDGGQVDRGPGGERRRRHGAQHRLRGGRGRAAPEARGRPGAPAAARRRRRGRVVLRRDGPHRRRLSRRRRSPWRSADRATRRQAPRSLAIASVIGALLTDTLAGPGARRHPHVEVPRAVGALHPRDDGRRVRDRRAAGGARCGGHAGRGRRLRDLRRPGLGRHGAERRTCPASGGPSARICRPAQARPPCGTRSTSTATRSRRRCSFSPPISSWERSGDRHPRPSSAGRRHGRGRDGGGCGGRGRLSVATAGLDR